MTRARKIINVITTAACLWSFSAASSTPANSLFADDFEPEESIQSLTISVGIGADGEDLNEPLALDLGLGFPLWLLPTTDEDPSKKRFGAIAQQRSIPNRIAAGESATFSFYLSGPSGHDPLQYTTQLLTDVTISDIARVGFFGADQGKWILAKYEIRINGRLFASNDDVNQKADETRKQAGLRLDALQPEISPLELEVTDLRTLVEADLASDDDRDRLAEVEIILEPLRMEKERLEALIAGTFPWFVESSFQPKYRESASVQAATVTLWTANHAGADSRNFTYFKTGGRKYRLSTPDQPLANDSEPQEFQLDLLNGPLTAADIRGLGIGMLAHSTPYGSAPDRWHPKRMRVELDGRNVYDSAANPLDQRSLSAIRIIPRAHRDSDGELVQNNPIARETFVWEAGTGQGLNELADAVELPEPGDEDFPEAEPGLDPDSGLAGNEDFPPFPGEADPEAGPEPIALEPPPFDMFPPDMPFPPGITIVFPPIDLPILGIEPPAFGDSFMVENVEIADGWKQGDLFKVTWTITGDDSQVDHYIVQMLHYDPEKPAPDDVGDVLSEGIVQPGEPMEYSSILAVPPVNDKFIFPLVIAMPVDPIADTPHFYPGPVMPLFRAGSQIGEQPGLYSQYISVPPGQWEPVSFGGEPPGEARAVWPFQQDANQAGIVFGSAAPGMHIGMRPEVGDEMMILVAVVPNLQGKFRIAAHVGYLDGTSGVESYDIKMGCRLHDLPDDPLFDAPTHSYGLVDVFGVTTDGPMIEIATEIDTADSGVAGADQKLVAWFALSGPAPNPENRPALLGLRVVPIE